MPAMELSTRVCMLFFITITGLLHCTHSNPDGFLNINCGSIDNVTGEKGLRWISDSPFIRTRNIWTRSSTETLVMQFWTLAYFKDPSVKKYCYLIPVKPRVNYLVRASFGPNYSVPLATFFDLLLEGIKWANVDLSGATGITCNKDDPPRVIIINLTGMQLKGTIPTNIADLTALTQLLLGNNKLSGHIPDLSSLKNLTKLQLQNNRLAGGIPESLEKLQMLTQLLLQDNKLEGTVPKGLEKPNLKLCVDPHNAVQGSRYKMKGVVMGLLIGCSVVLVLAILSGILLRRHKHPSEPLLTTDVPNSSQQHISADNQTDYHRLAMEYTEEDIKSSTNNYSIFIGKGSFGSVFYGTLSGYEVAVKLNKADSNQGQEEFHNEVAILSRIYHKNLVNLIGFCKQPIMALVYEYMPGGTLNDHLHGTPKLEKPLDWHVRLNIAQQAADGLLYLHQGCYPPIIHRDIKCSNILLDNRMCAKLADFGISKLVECSKGYALTEVKGTMGYLDPEYFATSSLNEKTDVYSFGVVLFEIISGVSAKDGLVQSAHKLISCGKLDELMDSSLGGQYNVESAWKVAEIAYMCVEKESTNRPKMSEVVKELEEAVTLASADNNDSAANTMAFSDIDVMPTPR